MRKWLPEITMVLGLVIGSGIKAAGVQAVLAMAVGGVLLVGGLLWSALLRPASSGSGGGSDPLVGGGDGDGHSEGGGSHGGHGDGGGGW